MNDFDLLLFNKFIPPKFQCRFCRAIFSEVSGWIKGIQRDDEYIFQWDDGFCVTFGCPVCNFYDPVRLGDNYAAAKAVDPWLMLSKHLHQFQNIDETQARKLANLVEEYLQYRSAPMRLLFAALLHAKEFVHFTTYGISHQIYGAMKMASVNCAIRGIVSNTDAKLQKEFDESVENSEAPNLRLVGVASNYEDTNTVPHTKIVIVDGLMAFKGSTNLTLSGLRKAQNGLDMFEVVTNVSEVIELNNKYFSPLWNTYYTRNNINNL